MDINNINLKYNPFATLTPSPDDNNLVWAGMGVQKKLLTEIYKEAFEFSPRKVILNWGQLGGGKTHAAVYFERNISHFLKINENRFFHVHINVPKDGKDANKEIIKNIFDCLSLKKIKKQISTVIKEIGEEELFEKVNKRVKSEAFTEAVINLCKDIYPTKIIQRFVFDGLSSAELKKLNLPRSLKTNEDYTTFLAAVIIAMSLGKEDKRLVLWVDELESMVYFNSQQFTVVSQMFRDLIDKVNKNLVVFFNFTLADNEQETVRILLGDALWARINKQIRFEILSLKDAMTYCKDSINLAQIDNSKKLTPFTVDSIEVVLKSIPAIDLIPREINRRFNDIIQFAFKNKQKEINKAFALEWVNVNKN